MQRDLFDTEHHDFRDLVTEFLEREVAPHHAERKTEGIVPRELWRRAGEAGTLGDTMPDEHGGHGITDFGYSMVVQEEPAMAMTSGVGLTVHADIGSDLMSIATSATLAGDHDVLNGAKTFISNDSNADLVIVACRTGEDSAGTTRPSVAR